MSEPPVLAIIANEQTPYRMHLHRRIAEELQEVELWSLFTHELASSPWRYVDSPEIRPVLFGKGAASASQGSLGEIGREWRKGGQILHWLSARPVGAVVLNGYNDLARLRIILWCKARRRPCFLFGDSNSKGDTATGLRRLVKQIYVRWVLKRVTGVFHCGTLGRDYFRRYGVSDTRLYPFPYEPDYALFTNPGVERVDALRRRFDLPSARRRFVFVGRLIAVKRPELLLEVFQAIAIQRPGWDLIFAGDGPLREGLERLAEPLGCRVRFTGFLSSAEDVAALYALCQVFVLPSDYEPWGVVVTEAAAAGLALVASSVVGAAADVLSQGVNGELFTASDAGSLRRALLAVSEPGRVESGCAASPEVLATWRRATDPVCNLRRALRDAGVLEP